MAGPFLPVSSCLVGHQDNGAERRNRGSFRSSRKFGASWAHDAPTARVASVAVPSTVICGHRRTTRRRASSASEPAERAVHFALCEAHTLLIEAGSKNHEEQASTRCRAVVSTPDNVERCRCRPELQLPAKNGLAGTATGAKCLRCLRCLRRTAGRGTILDWRLEALHLSRWAEEQHLDVRMVR